MALVPSFHLELHIQHKHDNHYRLDMHLRTPEKEEVLASDIPLTLDPAQLPTAETTDPVQSGRTLTDIIFQDKGVYGGWARATALAGAQGGQRPPPPLRVHLRLDLDHQHERLHRLPWELLQDPQQGGAICQNENIRFSRYLPSRSTAPALPVVSRDDMRALVAVANPTDLKHYHLAPIDVPEEVRRTRAALQKGIDGEKVTVLARETGGPPPTLNTIATSLRDSYSVFYLVGHGMFADGKPYLFLEQEDGKTDRIDSGVLVQWLCQLSRRPVLIVLASCQSAGDRSDGSALAAFGPRLVTEAGIGAVVAMHGNVPIQTVQEFMPPFFEELHRDGAIDRAVAAARRSMGISSKWWLPVLFLRMRDGQLWHEPMKNGIPAYNIPAIQELINKGFSAQEVEHLCFYHFREVYDDFAPEMSKQAKIRRWVEYCDGKSEFPDLLALLKEKNPKKYAEFESRLTMEP